MRPKGMSVPQARDTGSAGYCSSPARDSSRTSETSSSAGRGWHAAVALLLLVLMAASCSGAPDIEPDATDIEPEATDIEPEVAAAAAPLSPAPMPTEGPFSALSTGRRHTCAIRTDSMIECWGDNRLGQSDPPKGEYVAVSAGHEHSCAIRADGTIACWGGGPEGLLYPPDGKYVAVSAGHEHNCALRIDGDIQCWGSFYATGLIPPGGHFTAVATSGSHACALRKGGTVQCWSPMGSEKIDAPGGRFESIAVGDHLTCGVRPDERIECFDYAGTPRFEGIFEGRFRSVSLGVAMRAARGRHRRVLGTVAARRCRLLPRAGGAVRRGGRRRRSLMRAPRRGHRRVLGPADRGRGAAARRRVQRCRRGVHATRADCIETVRSSAGATITPRKSTPRKDALSLCQQPATRHAGCSPTAPSTAGAPTTTWRRSRACGGLTASPTMSTPQWQRALTMRAR